VRTLLAAAVLVAACGTASADKVVLVAGGGDGEDGSEATKAKLVQPFAVAFGTLGRRENIYFVEMVGGERLRMIDSDGKVRTVAGTGKKGDTTADPHGDASKAEFNGMHNLAVTKDGRIYLADTFNNRVRAFDPFRQYMMPVAGTGKKGFAGDGDVAEKAEFAEVICIALSPDEKTLYVADIGNKRVRAIDLETRKVSTVAGTGKSGVPKDGEPAKDQPLVDPRAVACDDKGNLYILERGGHALRVVDKDGKILTVAGSGKKGSGGNGGKALEAEFNGPKFVSIDRDGSVLIADTENHQIRRYVPGKEVVELVAGSGKAGGKLDPDPLKVELARPHGVSVHPKTGDLYIADSDNGRILKIERAK
jgi:DNA-binding beta-propeller fold protein YncE